MRILIIGGTHFVGHGMAQAALGAGHDVTLLHRNRTDELPDATHLLADRNGDLSVLDGASWDATIDVCAYLPGQVRHLHDALGDRGGHHLFVSTVSVYEEPDHVGADEDSRLFDEAADDVDEVTNETYGPLKVSCEKAAREAYGDAGLALIRPTYVVGPRDATARYPWWVLRAARGGTMLLPGPAGAPMQCVDARDMGAWTVHLAEDRVSGAFTAARPSTTFAAMVEETVAALGSDADLVQVDGDWLVEQGVDGAQLPLWSEGSPELALAMGTAHAEATGLTHRPFADVVRDTLAWAEAYPDQATNPRIGLAPERERQLLDTWFATQGLTVHTAHRLDGIPPTIFTTMSALAVRTGAVNLGQGFPDADGPESVLAAARDAIASGANQYAPGIGVAVLRQAIARHQQRHYGLELDPDRQVVVTTGCTEGIAAALLGLVDPGDEVVVLEPYYDSYVAMIQMVGGVRRPVTLRAPDFRLDVDELRAAVGPRTRFVLLNSPHNPTGTVLTRDELQAVADVAVEHDLVVITDEVYEHLTFDHHEHVPLATLPGMFERTLTLSSAGKSYSVTGWKVGWATGPAELVGAVLAAAQWLTFTSGAPLQPAVAHGLDHEAEWPRSLAASLEKRRDLLCDGLAALGLGVRRPEGTYFALTDISSLGWADGMEFCLALPERAGVVAIPAQPFHDSRAGDQLVRWAFCKEVDVIEEGLRRLAAADLSR